MRDSMQSSRCPRMRLPGTFSRQMLQVPGMVALTGIIPPWALPVGQGSGCIMLHNPWFQGHRAGRPGDRMGVQKATL